MRSSRYRLECLSHHLGLAQCVGAAATVENAGSSIPQLELHLPLGPKLGASAENCEMHIPAWDGAFERIFVHVHTCHIISLVLLDLLELRFGICSACSQLSTALCFSSSSHLTYHVFFQPGYRGAAALYAILRPQNPPGSCSLLSIFPDLRRLRLYVALHLNHCSVSWI
jgi:hypothetical protein